ncbi:unnamed protein product, partial [Amoebophrya sp. A25]
GCVVVGPTGLSAIVHPYWRRHIGKDLITEDVRKSLPKLFNKKKQKETDMKKIQDKDDSCSSSKETKAAARTTSVGDASTTTKENEMNPS